MTDPVKLYTHKANVHRTAEGVRVAALELLRQGLRVRDVAEALRLDVATVLAIVVESRHA